MAMGITKEKPDVEAWLKDVAPSNELRTWYHHDLERWDESRKRYFTELKENPDAWSPLVEAARRATITLLYSAKSADNNNAVALKEFLEKRNRTSDRK